MGPQKKLKLGIAYHKRLWHDDYMNSNLYSVSIPGMKSGYRVETTEREAINDARLYARVHGTSAVVTLVDSGKIVAVIPQV
jgi:hypothetical protein